ncbi:MAG: hypothetical protein IJI14_14370 [Anaerolineaceae bacterium]|nr:hypothetical protein [Anaerolineaceae bacterium]
MPNQNIDQNIADKLRRLKTLSEEGFMGEAAAAKRLLDKLLRLYGVTEEDFDDSALKDFIIRFHGAEEEKLLLQIVYKVTNSKDCIYVIKNKNRGHRKNIIMVQCTAAQLAEIEFLFDFYKDLWQKEKEMFLEAFVQKHKIFGKLKEGEEGESVSAEELLKLLTMMRSLSDETPVKRLPKGENV